MAVYIGECPLGVFAFDEEGGEIGFAKFPKDPEEIAERISLVRKGEPTNEHMELLEDILKKGYERIVVSSEDLASKLSGEIEVAEKAELEAQFPNKANRILRRSLRRMAEDLGFGDLGDVLRDVNTLLTSRGFEAPDVEKDKLTIEAVEMLDELDETINSLHGRLKEWYGMHFPELEKHVSYPRYLKLVSELGPKRNFGRKELEDLGLKGDDAEAISRAARDSVGVELDDADIEMLGKCSGKIWELREARDTVEDYLDGLMSQIAPNVKALVGSSIGPA